MSLELWCPQGRWGARVRHGVRGLFIPPDVPHLSDLLLLDPGPSPPDSLPDGLSRALPSPSVPSGGSVAVAWEVYGLGRRGEPITFGLSLVDEGASFVRRALNRIGLFRKDPVLTLSWTEEGPDRAGPFFRSVDVDLPRMDPGEYLLRLEMDTPYRSRVASSRRIEVF